ncbi:PEP-CTERM sorting domain-containing protein [Poriferisphaera sp. WC338]|uniref:PEP-CTERM sorting domain-containing protein n=1 Tax=Poriferisphaera sp. WC338 TaxID=3425129 RepID=UPI003D815329
MRLLTQSTLILSLIFALACSIQSASAATIQQQQNFQLFLPSSHIGNGSDPTPPTFNTFNTALGTLTHINLFASATISPNVAFERKAFVFNNLFNFPMNSTTFIGVPNTSSINITNNQTVSLNYAGLGSDDSVTFNTPSTNTASQSLNIANPAFTTGSNFNINVNGNINMFGSDLNDLEISSSTLANMHGTLTLTYVYTPVPEPTSLALISLAATPLIMRRKKQHQSQ